LVRNFGEFGIHLNYTLWDFGKRRATVRERSSQLAEAEQHLEHLKEKSPWPSIKVTTSSNAPKT